jgi:DNA polymerase-4
MKSTPKKTLAEIQWLFLDLNSFFASVEQQAQPKLRGRPMAVVPLMTNSTSVIAASVEAKLYGVKTGVKVSDAKRLCPELKLVVARHDLYVEYHQRILEELDRHYPVHRVESIDEMSFELDAERCELGRARDLAEQMRRGLRERVGECLLWRI